MEKMRLLYSCFMSETKKTITCPLCGCQDFKKDKAVLPKYGLLRISDFKTKVLIFKECGYILLFEMGNTYFLGVD